MCACSVIGSELQCCVPTSKKQPVYGGPSSDPWFSYVCCMFEAICCQLACVPRYLCQNLYCTQKALCLSTAATANIMHDLPPLVKGFTGPSALDSSAGKELLLSCHRR